MGGSNKPQGDRNGARVGTVGADIISDIKQAVKPQSPKRIVSRGGKTFKIESREKGQSSYQT